MKDEQINFLMSFVGIQKPSKKVKQVKGSK